MQDDQHVEPEAILVRALADLQVAADAWRAAPDHFEAQVAFVAAKECVRNVLAATIETAAAQRARAKIEDRHGSPLAYALSVRRTDVTFARAVTRLGRIERARRVTPVGWHRHDRGRSGRTPQRRRRAGSGAVSRAGPRRQADDPHPAVVALAGVAR